MDIVLNDLKVSYVEKGENDSLNIILLHGWGANTTAFNPVIENLSKDFKVYAIDFPGFGLSPKPPITYMVEDYSKLVIEFIKQKKLENVVLVGHSFGGRVIIKMIGKLGYKPLKVILVDSAGIKPKRTLKYNVKVGCFKFMKNACRIFLGKKLSEKIIGKLRNKMGSEDYKNADNDMKEIFKNVVNEDLTEYLPNINVPTLLIWGDKDLDTPLSDAKIMEEKIPDAGLVVIPGAGHFSYLNNLPLFLRVVNTFLKG